MKTTKAMSVRYTLELKQEAVRLVEDGGQSTAVAPRRWGLYSRRQSN